MFIFFDGNDDFYDFTIEIFLQLGSVWKYWGVGDLHVFLRIWKCRPLDDNKRIVFSGISGLNFSGLNFFGQISIYKLKFFGKSFEKKNEILENCLKLISSLKLKS